jgi:spore coat polysaccharide biosynthesis protein SpsF
MMVGSERAVAFVVVRLSSSRLPAKQLRPIGDRRLIDWVLGALAEARELERVVLTTVAEAANEPLREVAEQHGIDLFWYEGEVDDVVGRLCRAADAYEADICLLISADCPLVHGPSIDMLIRQLRDAAAADYLVVPADASGQRPLLEGVQIARRQAWHRADALSDRPELREHQFPVIYRNPGLFRRVDARLDPSLYGAKHRLSVDTWADLEFMETVYQHLADAGKPFRLPEVVGLLAQRPELKRVNQHVHQRHLIETVHPVLFVVDAGGPYGYGHFMRCRELGGQIVERLGWPVAFMLDDAKAAAMADACGFRVLWGALGRPPAKTPGREAMSVPQAVRPYGLLVVDISVQRSLPAQWRREIAAHAPVAMIDREDSSAAETDLIIYPGVTGRQRGERIGLPPVVEGLGNVILRREIRHFQRLECRKEIDVLAYLHIDEQKQGLLRLSVERGWRLHILDGFTEEFPRLLARSRVLLSGFGNSFYEALALHVSPVAWPLSLAHRADAQAFFRAAGLPEAIVDGPEALSREIAAALGRSLDRLRLEDGTPAIVRRLADLREAWK